jgi:hypothetical protein
MIFRRKKNPSFYLNSLQHQLLQLRVIERRTISSEIKINLTKVNRKEKLLSLHVRQTLFSFALKGRHWNDQNMQTISELFQFAFVENRWGKEQEAAIRKH